jgi:hypothetical protein
MKICNKCRTEKSLEQFNRNKHKFDGYHIWCKQCVSNTNKKLYVGNSERIKQQTNKYYYDNKDIILPKLKEYRNKPEIKNKQQQYIKEWVKDNKEHYKQYQNEYQKQYYKDNPHVLICLNIKRRCLNGIDDDRVKYNSIELKYHIETLFEPWMNWDNIGEWELHHNIPVSWFEIDTPPHLINDLRNLYPLSKEENRKIKNKYIKFNINKAYLNEIIQWIKKYHLSTIQIYL